MSNWLSSDHERGGMAEIQRRFSEMLVDGRHVFDAAANALLGGTQPDTIREDLFATDRRINQTEQQIRRQLVVHGTVHGPGTFPHLLVMMSLAKDAERIGDYAKNIFDLAVSKAWLGTEAELSNLILLKDQISRVLVRACALYETQDEKAARSFLMECDQIENSCDAITERALKLEGVNGAGLALAGRYFKRVASHAANVVTSLVMPLDKLDFFDEP